jgi:hypothetical protein
MSANSSPRWLLAVCYRSGYITLAVFADGELAEVRTKRLRDQRTKTMAMKSLIRRFALDYAVDTVVVEPENVLDDLVRTLGLPSMKLTLAEAKEYLLPDSERPTHSALYELLSKQGSPFRRLVNINPKNNNLITQQWRLVSLFPVALGLAAIKKSVVEVDGNQPVNHFTP